MWFYNYIKPHFLFKICHTENANAHSYVKKLRPALLEKGIIDPKTYTFSKDHLFNSPSAASAVILGRSSNGRVEWKHIKTNQTFADCEKSALNTQGKSN